MAKRPTARKSAAPTPTPTPAAENGLADKVAIAVGSTLGRLMNRKDALLAQLSVVEEKIAKASRRASDQLKAHLPASVPGLKRARKAKKKTARPKPSRTTTPSATHGPDEATVKTRSAAKVPGTRAPRATAPMRSAPRAPSRG